MAMGILGILGAGELGQQIAEIAKVSHDFSGIVFFDDTLEKGTLIGDSPVLGPLKDVPDRIADGSVQQVVLGVGFKHFAFRESLAASGADWPWATIIGEGCIIAPTARIGQGCVLYPGTVLDRQVKLGAHNILNLRTTISHDCQLGPHNFLAPCTVLSGFVEMGSANFIGTGSVISSRIKLGSCNFFGAGSVVVRDFGDHVKAYGNPARES